MENENVMMLKLKGHAKVELFDAKTGELQEVQEGDNVITSYGVKAFKDQMQQALAIGIPNVVSPSGVVGDNSLYYQLIKSLFTTDNDAVPTVDDATILGNIVGWAPVTMVSAVDLKRGIMNQVESISSNGKLKFVFDFASDRGNGTHKSVWLSDMRLTATTTNRNLASTIKPNGAVALPVSVSFVIDGGDYYYAPNGYAGGTTTSIYKLSKVDLSLVETIVLPRSATGAGNGRLGYWNDHLYYHSSTTLYKYNLTSRTEVATASPTNIANSNAWAILSNQLYYTNGTTCYRFDVENMVANTSKTSPMISAGSNMFVVNNMLVGQDINAFVEYDFINNTFTTNTIWLYRDTGEVLCNRNGEFAYVYPALNGGFFLNNKFYLTLTNSYYYVNSSNSYTTAKALVMHECDTTLKVRDVIAHKLLDSPVTKTSAQTMKITYEINIS